METEYMTNAERQKRNVPPSECNYMNSSQQEEAEKRNAPVTENVTRVTASTPCGVTETIGGVPVDIAEAVIKARTVSLEHYRAHPELYVERAFPDKLNWGPWLNMTELEAAGLKANRIVIPGDWDYEGVYHEQTTIS